MPLLHSLGMTSRSVSGPSARSQSATSIAAPWPPAILLARISTDAGEAVLGSRPALAGKAVHWPASGPMAICRKTTPDVEPDPLFFVKSG